MKKEILKYIKHGDAYSVAGKANGKERQHVMQVITGVKLPIARCGINAIRNALFEVSGVTGNCLAVKETNLNNWLKGV